jgi:hypothetical protein
MGLTSTFGRGATSIAETLVSASSSLALTYKQVHTVLEGVSSRDYPCGTEPRVSRVLHSACFHLLKHIQQHQRADHAAGE